MIEIFRNPNYDFMRPAKALILASALTMVASIAMVAVRGLNYGIEFTGGTELQVKYADAPDLAEVRSSLEQAGLTSPVVTTIGDPSEHEVYIRLGSSGAEGEVKNLTGQVMAALRGGRVSPTGIDLNVADAATLREVLRDAPGLPPDQQDSLAKAIAEKRKKVAIFRSVDDLADIPGMMPEALEQVRSRTVIGPIALRSQSYIGPTIGRELLRKALLAIVGSLLAMLAYIGFRFQLRWGAAAVVALLHDTIITLGFTALFQKEISLPVVAAFLTLVGYSVNDTVVIFDRIRENLANRPGANLAATINLSVNQTLSRTIITSGLTWLAVFALYLFGGPALNAFAFVMTFGVIVGSYSTIYIASVLLVLWEQRVAGQKAAAAAAPDPTRTTRKVRS